MDNDDDELGDSSNNGQNLKNMVDCFNEENRFCKLTSRNSQLMIIFSHFFKLCYYVGSTFSSLENDSLHNLSCSLCCLLLVFF